MLKNIESEGSLLNTDNSLDIYQTNQVHRPKTVNTTEQNMDKYSFSGKSINSNIKTKENESYKNFISRIKLNYNLLHPKQRKQIIILHSNLDKSMNMSDVSANDIKNNDISDNINDNLNTGFISDNSGSYNNNPNRRRTINFLNRVHHERLEKGEEEKNNLSVETKKNNLNPNFYNSIFDNNNNDSSKINLGNIFNNIHENTKNDKVFLPQNCFNDGQIWETRQRDEVSNRSDNINSYSNQNNPFSVQNINKNQINIKTRKSINRNFIGNINDSSTNMNTNNTNKDSFPDKRNENNQKEIISSFNYGLNNNSLQNLRNSYFGLGNNSEEIINKSNNDTIELNKYLTFRPNDKEIYENIYNPNTNQSNIYSNSKTIPNDKTLNNKNNNEHGNFPKQEENKSRLIPFIKNSKVINYKENDDIINNHDQKNVTDNNNIYQNNEDENNNIKLNFVEKGNNQIKEENNYIINKEIEKDSSLSLTISDLDEKDLEIKKKKRDKKLCKSFLYGLLFGCSASGIFWLKNEETRKFFLEKIKGINFNSIINFLRVVFSNPVEFFKKIFSDGRRKDYMKVIGLTMGKFFDIFENYDDWFRLIGIVLSIYLVWIIIKSLIKTFFRVWKYYN